MTLELPILGKLTVTEIHGWYDGPQLFFCDSADGTTYLASAVDEHPHHDTWLFVKVSDDRVRQIEESDIDLRTAFTHPEQDELYVVEWAHLATTEDEVITQRPSELHEDWLPPTGEYL